MIQFVLMLEDDEERVRRFRRIVGDRHPSARVAIYRTAASFIDAFDVLEEAPSLVCLDHDLFPMPGDLVDPGDGRDVSAHLATRRPIAPVLIHSTNAPAADSMLFQLEDAGWTVDRISPLGEDWIEAYWYPSVLQMVRDWRLM